MGIPYFGGDAIATEAHCVNKGSSAPKITIYPRTIGGLIQESGVVEQTVLLKCYMIPPINTNRTRLELFFNEMNERLGQAEDTLIVNGNSYLKANCKQIRYEKDIVSNYVRYSIDFQLNDQNTGSAIRQLPCSGLQNFSRGRKLKFVTTMDDGTTRTFTFWHNFDSVRDFETRISVKHSNQYDGYTRVTRHGGFENIVCDGWIIGPESSNRQNIEAYFYNIMNAVVGRIGTIVLDDGTTIKKAFLASCTPEDTVHFTVRYQLTFIASLQC